MFSLFRDILIKHADDILAAETEILCDLVYLVFFFRHSIIPFLFVRVREILPQRFVCLRTLGRLLFVMKGGNCLCKALVVHRKNGGFGSDCPGKRKYIN